MKRGLMIFLAVLFTTGVALAAPAANGAKALSVRTFQFKYKTADRAAGAPERERAAGRVDTAKGRGEDSRLPDAALSQIREGIRLPR